MEHQEAIDPQALSSQDSKRTNLQVLARAVNSAGDDTDAVAASIGIIKNGSVSNRDLVHYALYFPTDEGRSTAFKRLLKRGPWLVPSYLWQVMFRAKRDKSSIDPSEDMLQKQKEIALSVKVPLVVAVLTVITLGLWKWRYGSIPATNELFWYLKEGDQKIFIHLPFAITRYYHLIDLPLYTYLITRTFINIKLNKQNYGVESLYGFSAGIALGLLFIMLMLNHGFYSAEVLLGLCFVISAAPALWPNENNSHIISGLKSAYSYITAVGIIISFIFGPAVGIPIALIAGLFLALTNITFSIDRKFFRWTFAAFVFIGKGVVSIAKKFVYWLTHWP